MFTFVIDIHGGLAKFENTTPFLYPLRKEIYMVPLSENTFTKIPEAAENVRKYLEREIIRQWQVVFLVDLAVRHPNPLVGSLTYYLYAIKEKFVEKLKQSNLSPKDIFILGVDSLERGLRGKPLDPENALRWELDTKGIRDDVLTEDYTFNTNEVKSLDSLWGKRISIRDESFGRGIHGLSKELQAELKSRREKLEKGIDDLLKKKKDQLLKEKFSSDDDVINRLMLESWKNIKIDFLERIKEILLRAESAAALENFLPSEILEDVIKHNIGIHSEYFSKEFTLIRFPFPPGQLQDFHKKVLQLTFLIIAIAENDLGSRLDKHGSYTVEMDEKEIDKFSQLLYDYHQCLRINAEDLQQKINNPGHASLIFMGYNTQKCGEELKKQEIKKATFNFYLDHDAVTQLREWKYYVIRAIENTDTNRHDRIGRCIEQNRKVKIVEREEKIEDLRQRTRQLKNEYLARVKFLPQEDFLASPDINFKSDIAEKGREIQDALNRRPTKNQFRLISAAAFLILYLSIFYNLEKTGDLLIWAGVSLLAVAAAGYFCRQDFKKRISLMVEDVTTYAKGVILRIIEKFEAQKEYLLKLFNVNIARKNYLEAENERIRQEEGKVLQNFHLNELDIHSRKADNLCELYPMENQSYEGLGRKNFHDLTLEEAIFRNEIYSPTSFRKNPQRHEYRIGVDEGFHSQSSLYLHVVDKISFVKDKVYPGGD